MSKKKKHIGLYIIAACAVVGGVGKATNSNFITVAGIILGAIRAIYEFWKLVSPRDKVLRVEGWLHKIFGTGTGEARSSGLTFNPGSNNDKFKRIVLAYTKEQIENRNALITAPDIFKMDFGLKPIFKPGGPEDCKEEAWERVYKNQFSAITGKSGSGKSFEMIKRVKYACDELDASYSEHGYLKDAKIPLFVDLKSMDSDLTIDWIAEYISKSAAGSGNKGLDSKSIKAMIEAKEVIFYFDGLDEVAIGYREQYVDEILKLANWTGVHIGCRDEIWEDILYKYIQDHDQRPALYYFKELSTDDILEIIKKSDYTSEEKSKIEILVRKNDKLRENLSRSIILNLFLILYNRLTPVEKKDLETAEGEKALEILWRNYEDFIFWKKLPADKDILQIRTYCVWLAKIMKQEPFFIESIQPRWILNVDKDYIIQPAKILQKFYYLVTRVFAAVVIGFSLSCIISVPGLFLSNSILGGIIVSVIAGIYNREEENSRLSLRTRNFLFIAAMLGALILFCGFYQGISIPRSPKGNPITFFSIEEIGPGVLLGIGLSAMLSYRIILEKEKKKYILPVESFRFDWPHAIRYGISCGLIAGIIVGAIALVLKQQGALFLDKWLEPFITSLSYKYRGTNSPGVSMWIAIFAFAFLVSAFVVSVLIISIAGRYNDPKESDKRTRFNYGIYASLKQAFIHAAWTVGVVALLYIFLLTKFNIGTWPKLGWTTLGVGLLSFLWYGGMEAFNHVLLRVTLYIRGIAPLFYGPWVKMNEQMGLITPTGYKMNFYHTTLATYYSNYSLSDDRRTNIKRRKTDVVAYWGVFILILGMLTLPFVLRYGYKIYWTSPGMGVNVSGDAVTKKNDSVYLIKKNGKLKFMTGGSIFVGSYVGFVNPGGTDKGFMGMPMGEGYNVPYLARFRHGALLYRLRSDSGAWSSFGYADTTKPFPVKTGDSLQLAINDREWQNDAGWYTLNLTSCDSCRN